MRRLILLALVLSALVWVASARAALPQPDEAAMSAVGGPYLLTDESDESRDEDQQWRSQHHTIAVIESASGSKLTDAEFATPFAHIFATSSAVRAPALLVRATPYYLRHTPLLI